MLLNIDIRSIIVILISFIIIISNTGCITQNKEEKVSLKDDIIIGLADSTYDFYPWWTSYDVSSISINHNIFNSLVSFDGLFRIKAELAESWNNPNNLTWRFRLKKDVKFHNGYNLTTEDVKYSFDSIKNNETNVLRDLLLCINETKIIDKYTFDIITYKPTPVLLNKLTDIFIISKRYQEETTQKWPIGTGAYKVSEYVDKSHLVLERFENYWRKQPDVKKATFKFIEDNEARKNALIKGEIDIAEGIEAVYYDNLSKMSEINLHLVTYPTIVYISFNFRENITLNNTPERKNPLSDIRVRKALYHAINVDDIIKKVYNNSIFAEPASQFVTPLIYGYNPNITRLQFDLNKSRDLLNQSGYIEGFDLVMDCAIEHTTQTKICEIIDEQLSLIINFSLNIQPVEDYYHKILSRNTSCYIIGWMAATGDGGEIYDYLIRTVDNKTGIGTYNLGYYSNPEIDRIGEEITYIMDYDKRLKLMQEGFEIAMEDVVWIPLLTSKLIYGVAEDVNWEPSYNLILKIEEIKF
jgi:peptide/nickel transport system substrate-binding protein